MTSNTPETQALEPCPKCQSADVRFGGYGRGVYCVICSSCHIQTAFYPTRAAASSAWNTRQSSSNAGGVETIAAVKAWAETGFFVDYDEDGVPHRYSEEEAVALASGTGGDVQMAVQATFKALASLSTPTAEPMGDGTRRDSQSHSLPGDEPIVLSEGFQAEEDVDTFTIRFPDGHAITAWANGRLIVTKAEKGFSPFAVDVAALTPSALSGDAGEGE